MNILFFMPFLFTLTIKGSPYSFSYKQHLNNPAFMPNALRIVYEKSTKKFMANTEAKTCEAKYKIAKVQNKSQA